MVQRAWVFGLVLAAVAGPAAAQSPRITSAGDPSVRPDTIYRLAVDPADHPSDDFVYRDGRYLKIDNTALAPDEVARLIVAHFALKPES